MDTPSTIRFVLCFQKSKRSQRNLKGNSGVGEKLANSDMECGEMMMSIHPNKGIKLDPLHPFYKYTPTVYFFACCEFLTFMLLSLDFFF